MNAGVYNYRANETIFQKALVEGNVISEVWEWVQSSLETTSK